MAVQAVVIPMGESTYDRIATEEWPAPLMLPQVAEMQAAAMLGEALQEAMAAARVVVWRRLTSVWNERARQAAPALDALRRVC